MKMIKLNENNKISQKEIIEIKKEIKDGMNEMNNRLLKVENKQQPQLQKKLIEIHKNKPREFLEKELEEQQKHIDCFVICKCL